MGHIVLLGDSIFDNAGYVPGGPPVIEQLRGNMPGGWKATLLAVDGNVSGDVEQQLTKLPADATHLVVSVGGNDALGAAAVMHREVRTVREAVYLLHQVQQRFADLYHRMIQALLAPKLPAVVCTIYDSVPGLGEAERTALAVFNDVILREACRARLPAIDLHLVCADQDDYSSISPIEPSVAGGAKISAAIARVVRDHDFAGRRCVVYSS